VVHAPRAIGCFLLSLQTFELSQRLIDQEYLQHVKLVLAKYVRDRTFLGLSDKVGGHCCACCTLLAQFVTVLVKLGCGVLLDMLDG
jgi:hypothetical protein